MSHYYGGGFDEWIEDSIYGPITPAQVEAIKRLMAPFRESIELALEGFDNDQQSWRQFRNDLWYSYPEQSKVVTMILKGEIDPLTVPATVDGGEKEYGALVMGASA